MPPLESVAGTRLDDARLAAGDVRLAGRRPAVGGVPRDRVGPAGAADVLRRHDPHGTGGRAARQRAMPPRTTAPCSRELKQRVATASRRCRARRCASTGTACRSGGGCAPCRRCSPSSARRSSRRRTATAGCSRTSTRRNPWRSVARASLELFIARSEAPKERYIARMVGALRRRRRHLPRLPHLPEQLEHALRHAGAHRGATRHPDAGARRRRERPALFFGRAGADERRGIRRAADRCASGCARRGAAQ